MKCPKCGFVSYPGLPQCKKCGYRFQKAAPTESSSFLSSLFSGKSPPPEAGPARSSSILGLSEPPPGPSAPSDIEPSPPSLAEPVTRASPLPPPPKTPQAELFTERAPHPSNWHEELSERVEKFRQRRARLRGDSSDNLDFDFEKAEGGETESALEDKVIEFPQGETAVDTDLRKSPEDELPLLETLPIEKTGGGLRVLTSAAVEAGEVTFEPKAHEVEPSAEPMEILVPSSPPFEATVVPEISPLVLPLAPLGRRFLAGLADAVALLMGACLFILIFWRTGGHLSPQPLNFVVLGLIALFFLMVYFGLFTALTSATPGLLWMGLEVRNVDGNYPSAREAFLRAFGYIVSSSALMLGFVWAAVDSDGLTWHDRMSGTFITVATTR